MKGKVSAGILGIASIMGGVDASTLNEQPIEVVETVAGYEVKAEQVGDVVEATLPWKDQPGITVAYDMGEPSLTERFTDKRTEQVVMEKVDFGDGGFKIDVLLSEKPSTNKFCYQIEGAENYDFFYQPPLTKEEIAEGASRPPEIEGSYAVYHKTLKNHVIGQENYATGKVMHIPRPQVWEIGKEDQKVWADLSYDAGQLCVTAPQEFIDNADYTNGVRIDPTFGYTTQGASGSSHFTDTQDGGKYTTTEFSQVSSLSVYLTTTGSTFKGGIYDSAGTSVLAQSSGVSSTPGWNSVELSASLSPGDYWLEILFDSVSIPTINYDVVASISANTNSLQTYPNLKATVSDNTDNRFSIYATYTTIPQTTLRLNNGTIRINNGTLDI